MIYDIYARITPAYAGKREYLKGAWGVTRDHPRVCGEKLNCVTR